MVDGNGATGPESTRFTGHVQDHTSRRENMDSDAAFLCLRRCHFINGPSPQPAQPGAGRPGQR